MHPQQPPGGQQFVQPVHGYAPYAGQQPNTPQQPVHPGQQLERGLPSGITAHVSATLGCCVGFGMQALIFLTLYNQTTAPKAGELVAAVGVTALLSVPALAGASGIFAGKRFGRWLLLAGLVLPGAFCALWSTSGTWFSAAFLVAALAAGVLAVSPTTGRYLRAKSELARDGAIPEAHGTPWQYQPQQYSPQQFQAQQPWPQQHGIAPYYGSQWQAQWQAQWQGQTSQPGETDWRRWQ